MFGGNKPPPEYGSNNQANPTQPTGLAFRGPNVLEQQPQNVTTSAAQVLLPAAPVFTSPSMFVNPPTTQVPVFGREAPSSSFRVPKQPERAGSAFPVTSSFPNVFGKTGFGASTFSVFQPTSTGSTSTPVFSSSAIKPVSQNPQKVPQPPTTSSTNLFALPSSIPKNEPSFKTPDPLQQQTDLVHQNVQSAASASAAAPVTQPSLFGGKSTTHSLFSGSTTTGYHFGKTASTVPVFPVKANPFGSTVTTVASEPLHSQGSSMFAKPSVFGGTSYSSTDKLATNREQSATKAFTEQRNAFQMSDQAAKTKEEQFSFPQTNTASFQTIQQRDPRVSHHKSSISRPRAAASSSSVSRHRKSKELEDMNVPGGSGSQKRPSLQRPTLGLFEQALAGIKDKPQHKFHAKSSIKSVAEVKEEMPAKLRRVSEEEVEARAQGHEVHLMSPEQVSKLKSVVCKGIPAQYNTERFIRHKFSKYGKVSRIYCNPAKESAILHFSSNKAAADAKRSGSSIFPVNPPVVIFWSQTTKKKDSPEIKSPVEKRPKPSTLIKYVPSATSDDDEIAAELRSMTSCNIESLKFLERPAEKAQRGTRDRSDNEKMQHIEKSRHADKQIVMDKSSRKGNKASSKAVASRLKKTASSGVPISASSKSDIQETSSNLLQIRAVSAAERYRVLDQRDKLLRQSIKKDTNVETAANLLGTCPDMCPEKERYLREDRGQLHVFEMEFLNQEGSDVYHKAAVKEYSRSSADQEEPLPHELRPSDTLSMTMDYLVCNFMDRLEDSDMTASEWFDFLWNRTRAIRKDITQQHLCDLTTVALVEKCARFHIHCAHYLCEEDRSTFDQKINDENLTKCLQTLKHLYHDLNLKEISCPHEAEFRAYDVLLNLFQGDTLRQVQKLSPQVQTSPEVRFSIQVFAAFNSNNYVRFYKLVTRSSYMNACIMHRYFNHVRTRALHTLVRAHCPSATPVSYSLLEFVRLLGFEDSDEAENFCSTHGIVADSVHLILDRGNFCQPISLSYPKRGRSIVDSKRTCAVGEVVNGGQLPPNPYFSHLPHNSFLPDDRLNPNALGARDQAKVNVPEDQPSSIEEIPTSLPTNLVALTTTAPLTSTTPPPPLPTSVSVQHKQEQDSTIAAASEHVVISNEVVKDIARELILSVMDDLLQEVGYDCLTNAQALTNTIISVADSCILDATNILVRDLASEVVMQYKLELQQKQQQQDAERAVKEEAAALAALKMSISQETQHAVVEDVVKNETLTVAEEVVTELRAEHNDIIADCCEHYLEELVVNIVEREIFVVADETFMVAVKRNNVLRKADALAQKLSLKSVHHYFQCWKEVVAKSRCLRRSEEEFPAIPGLTLNTPAGKREKAVTLVVATPLEQLSDQMALCKLVDLGLQYQLLNTKFHSLPLNITDVIAPFLFADLQPLPSKSSIQTAYWKLIVSFPDLSDLRSSHSLIETCQWLKAKLSKEATGIGDLDQLQTLSLYTVDLNKSESGHINRLSLCIKAVDGLLNHFSLMAVQQMHQLRGTKAILFVLPPPTSIKQDVEFWREQNCRLEQLLDLCQSDPPIPLLVLLTRWDEGNLRKGSPFKHLKLETLKQQGRVSAFFVMVLKDDLCSTETVLQLHNAISLLSQNKPLIPPVNRKYLCDFVEDIVTNYFFVPAYENLAQRQRRGLVSQPPEVLIDLYNASIDHAVKVINLTCEKKFPSPVVEFCESPDHPSVPPLYWNSADHAAKLKTLVTALKLPMYETQEFDSWDDLCEDIRKFVASLTKPDGNSVILKSRIDSLLKKTHYSFQQQCQLLYYARDVEPFEDNLPWTEIIQACADYKLNLLPGGLSVFYLDDDIQAFTIPNNWRISLKKTQEEACTTLDDTLNRAALKRKVANSITERNQQVKRRLTSFSTVQPAGFEQERSNIDSLLAKIRSERFATEEFNKTLQDAFQEVSALSDSVCATPPSSPTVPLSCQPSTATTEHHFALQRRHSLPIASSYGTSKASMQDCLSELQFVLKSEREHSQMFERRLKLFETLDN